MDGHSRFGPDPAPQVDFQQLAQAPGGEAIGQVDVAQGDAFVVRADGTEVPAEAGMDIFLGDVIQTKGSGSIGLIFIDDSTFSLAENGQMTIDEMVYDPATNQGTSLFNVAEGVFTFVSGEIAKTAPDAMQIETPVATVGIRGTAGGGRIFNPQLLDPASTLPPRGMFTNFRDPTTGQPGEFTVNTPTGSQTLNSINATSNVPNPFVPPSRPVKLPAAALKSVFAAAVASLPRSRQQQNQQNNQDDAAGTQGPGQGPQTQGGDLADTLTTDDAPAEGDAAIQAEADALANQAFEEALAQGGDIGLALEVAAQVAGDAVARFGVAQNQLDTFTAEAALNEVISSTLSQSLGGLGGFGPNNPLAAGAAGESQFAQQADQLSEIVDDIVDLALFDAQLEGVGAQSEVLLGLAGAGIVGADFVAESLEDVLLGLENQFAGGFGGDGDFAGGGGFGEFADSFQDTFDAFFNDFAQQEAELIAQQQDEFFPDDDFADFLGITEDAFAEFILATTGDDNLVGSDDNTAFVMIQGASLGGDDLVDGGLGTDEISLLDLYDGWLQYDPGLSAQQVNYSFDGGSLTGSIDLTSVEQIYAADNSETFTEISNTDVVTNIDNGVRLALDLTGVGYIGAGTTGADNLSVSSVNSDPSSFGLTGATVTTGGTIDGSLIFGNAGNDTLTGSGGGDILFGGTGDDYLTGGAGSDILVGGTGSDTIIGGDGGDQIALGIDGSSDTIQISGSSEFGDFIDGFEVDSVDFVDDVIQFAGSLLSSLTGTFFTSTTSGGSFATAGLVLITDNIDTTDSTSVGSALSGLTAPATGQVNLLVVGNGSSSQIWYWNDTGDGDPSTGSLTKIADINGVDQSTLTSSNFLGVTDGNHTVSGTQTVTLTASITDTVTGSANADTITLSGAAESGDSVSLAGGTDSLTLDNQTNVISVAGTETVTGGTGNDTITISDATNTTVILSSGGNDTVNMGSGGGTVVGGNNLTSADTVAGTNGGTDILTLSGDYSAGLDLTSFTEIDQITLADSAGYNLTLAAGTADSTNGLTVDGSAVSTAAITVDGSSSNDNLTITGSDYTNTNSTTDVLTGGTGTDIITGGLGRDSIVLNADGNADWVMFNGTADFGDKSISFWGDDISNFERGAGGDVLSFGSATTTGNGFQSLATLGTISSTTGFVKYTTLIGSYLTDTVVATAMNTLSGLSSHSELYFLTTDGTNHELWYWDDSTGNSDNIADAAELTPVALIQGSDNTFTADNFDGFV